MFGFVFTISLWVFLQCSFLHSQQHIVYGQEDEHSRAICRKGKELFVGTNLGNIYRIKGNNIQKITLDKYPEIRDIQVFGNKLYVMQTGEVGKMLCFKKGISSSYKLIHSQTFTQDNQAVFLDGFHISRRGGFLMGDPVNGVFALYTLGATNEWQPLPKVSSLEGEAAFAASGSTVFIEGNTWYFVTGGIHSRFFTSTDKGNTWMSQALPFTSCISCGAYSMSVVSKRKNNVAKIILVGGDYTLPNNREHTSLIQSEGAFSWVKPQKLPFGYRSSVVFNKKTKVLFSGGSNGVDYSEDFGNTWIAMNTENCFAALTHREVLFVSTVGGKIIKVKHTKK